MNPNNGIPNQALIITTTSDGKTVWRSVDTTSYDEAQEAALVARGRSIGKKVLLALPRPDGLWGDVFRDGEPADSLSDEERAVIMNALVGTFGGKDWWVGVDLLISDYAPPVPMAVYRKAA